MVDNTHTHTVHPGVVMERNWVVSGGQDVGQWSLSLLLLGKTISCRHIQTNLRAERKKQAYDNETAASSPALSPLLSWCCQSHIHMQFHFHTREEKVTLYIPGVYTSVSVLLNISRASILYIMLFCAYNLRVLMWVAFTHQNAACLDENSLSETNIKSSFKVWNEYFVIKGFKNIRKRPTFLIKDRNSDALQFSQKREDRPPSSPADACLRGRAGPAASPSTGGKRGVAS